MIRSTNDFNKISKRNIFEPKVPFRRGKVYTVPEKVFAYAILFIIVHEAFSCHLVTKKRFIEKYVYVQIFFVAVIKLI